MKTKFLILILALCFNANYAQADSTHHPDASDDTPEPVESSMHNGMMGKMDMGQMMTMMHQCMQMHDEKKCDHDVMEKCSKDMGKDKCMKMMKEVKKQEPKTK